MIIYKNTIFELTSGESDDFNVRDICKSLKDIDTAEALRAYFDENEYRSETNFNRYDFDKWLLTNKYCEKVEYVEWFTDLYGKVQYT